MPGASLSIAKQLGLTETPDKIDPASLKWGELREGTAIGEVQPIFPRLDKTKIMSEIQNKETPVVTETPTEPVPE